jgi:hypothetical protein
MANKAKKTQKGNFGATFENLINAKTLHTFTEEVLETNEFGYYMNSIQRLEIIELYDSIVDDVIEEYIQNNPKVKKITDKAKQNIRSLATHMVFEIFDNSLYNEEYDWYETSNLLLNNYFFNEENVVAAVSASISKYGKEIDSEVFKPTMTAEQASKKLRKIISNDEFNQLDFPIEIKYNCSSDKVRLDSLWDEYLKSEYYVYHIMGFDDEFIIDNIATNSDVEGFSAWLEGYFEGVNEAKGK